MNDIAYWKDKWTHHQLEAPNNFAQRAYERIKSKNLKTLLDVGCGNGRDSLYFFQKGLQVTAIDFSESGIQNLKNKEPGIKTLQQNIHDIQFPKNTFDVIYAHLSLHYFDDQTTNTIFHALYAILKEHGLLFVKCKSTNDPLFGKGEMIAEDMYREGHVRHFFSKEYMKEKLKDFKILQIRKTNSAYHGTQSSFIEAVAMK